MKTQPMDKQLRDQISQPCEQLLLRSKQLIARSREILTTFQLAKQRVEASGLVEKRIKPKVHSRHIPRLTQEDHNRPNPRQLR
jgi:hypothetical protein